MSFLDDYSRKLWTKPLAIKSDAAQAIKDFVSLNEKVLGKQVIHFRPDNGGEYTSNALEQYFSSKRISHETTTPYSSQRNGVAERVVNCTIVEGAPSKLANSGLHDSLWKEGMQTFNHCKNLTPHSALNGNILPSLGH